MNIEGKLKKTIATGRVLMGANGAKKAVGKGEAKLLIVAQDCPNKKEIIDMAGAVPLHIFPGKT